MNWVEKIYLEFEGMVAREMKPKLCSSVFILMSFYVLRLLLCQCIGILQTLTHTELPDDIRLEMDPQYY